MLLTKNLLTLLYWSISKAVDTGEFETSMRQVADETKLPLTTINGIIKRLRTSGVIDIQPKEALPTVNGETVNGEHHIYIIKLLGYKNYMCLINPILDYIIKSTKDKINLVFSKRNSAEGIVGSTPFHSVLPTSANDKKRSLAPHSNKKRVPLVDLRVESTEIVLAELNKLTNSNYRVSATNKKYIFKLLRDGSTKEEMLEVVKYKCQEWGNNTRMQPYLRPSTLFGENFESYLQQARTKTKDTWDHGNLWL
jgi:uncharacterized phage protein (TIGR02220 family)